MSMKLQCTILTPDRILYEGDVHFAVVQAYDGEAGFLYNHAPLVSELGIGEVRLRTGELTEFFTVEGGFVEIRALIGEKPCAEVGMLFHHLVFVVVELRRFFEDEVRDSHLAHVVEHGGHFKNVPVLLDLCPVYGSGQRPCFV